MLVLNSAEFPWSDGGKKARSPGRARRKPLKPLRGESRLNPSEPVVTTLVCYFILHARLRVQRAPAFPAPSIFEGDLRNNSGKSRRGNANYCLGDFRVATSFEARAVRAPSHEGAQFAAPGDLAITSKITFTDMSVPQNQVRLVDERWFAAGLLN
jgi:hypothetical protein